MATDRDGGKVCNDVGARTCCNGNQLGHSVPLVWTPECIGVVGRGREWLSSGWADDTHLLLFTEHLSRSRRVCVGETVSLVFASTFM